MTESEFTRWFCDQLERCNCYVLAIVASAMQQPGIPDRYVAGKDLPGCWLEFKKDRNQPSEAQRLVLRNFDERAVPHLVVRVAGREVTCETREGYVLTYSPLGPDLTPVKCRALLVDAVARWRERRSGPPTQPA